LNFELAESFVPPTDRVPKFRAEAVAIQRVGSDSIEPHGSRVRHLLFKREGLRSHNKPMARGALVGSPFQLREQVGRYRPAVRANRSGEADALELSQPPSV